MLSCVLWMDGIGLWDICFHSMGKLRMVEDLNEPQPSSASIFIQPSHKVTSSTSEVQLALLVSWKVPFLQPTNMKLESLSTTQHYGANIRVEQVVMLCQGPPNLPAKHIYHLQFGAPPRCRLLRLKTYIRG